METGSPGDSFPQPIIRYSVLRYLQKRVAERCAALPVRFDSLEEWQVYRHRLIDALREKLPVWELDDSYAAKRTACADLGDDLTMEREIQASSAALGGSVEEGRSARTSVEMLRAYRFRG